MPMTPEQQAFTNRRRQTAYQTRRWYHETRQDTPPLVLQTSPPPRQRFPLETCDKVLLTICAVSWGTYFALYLRF